MKGVSAEKLVEVLSSKFGIWAAIVDGDPTAGESYVTVGEFEGLPVVDYYDSGMSPLYVCGVLKPVLDAAEKLGWEGQLYDPGTVKFYRR